MSTTDDLYCSDGPVATLPGSSHDIPEGAKCDFHPARPAHVRIQGETDSFGCEYHVVCLECAREMRKERRNRIGTCEWCKADDVHVRSTRDYEEGMAGRVYDVCTPCRRKQDDDTAAELAEYDDDNCY